MVQFTEIRSFALYNAHCTLLFIQFFGWCDLYWSMHLECAIGDFNNNKMIVRKSGIHWNVLQRTDVNIWTTFKHILEHQSLFMCNLHWSFIYCTIFSFLRVKGNFDCRYNDHSRIYIAMHPCIFGLEQRLHAVRLIELPIIIILPRKHVPFCLFLLRFWHFC